MPHAAAFSPLNALLKIVLLIYIGTFLGISGCSEDITNDIGEEAVSDSDVETVLESQISNISIAKIYRDAVDIEVEYYYDGGAGDYPRVIVELITEDKISNALLRKTANSVARKGSGKTMARIERPMLEVEEFVTEEIKVTFTKNRTPEILLEKTVRLPVVWESKLDDPMKESLDYWRSNAGHALQSGYFVWLDRKFKQWNDPEVRTVDGKWRLDAIISIMDGLGIQRRGDSIYKNIQEWKEHSPDLPGPPIVESIYWDAYAWHARGGGYASEVTETGWELFKERLAKAEKVLLDSKDYASDNPLWYYQYLKVAIGLGWDKPEILKLFLEAVSKEPEYYQTYFMAIAAMSPKWGGSYELMDKVATGSAEFTRKQEGDVVYARVYWAMDGLMSRQDNFFENTLVDWGRMKSGLEQLLMDYPESTWNLSNFASFACRAGDKEVYLRLREKIDLLRSDPRAWKSGYSPDTCDHMFMERL